MCLLQSHITRQSRVIGSISKTITRSRGLVWSSARSMEKDKPTQDQVVGAPDNISHAFNPLEGSADDGKQLPADWSCVSRVLLFFSFEKANPPAGRAKTLGRFLTGVGGLRGPFPDLFLLFFVLFSCCFC